VRAKHSDIYVIAEKQKLTVGMLRPYKGTGSVIKPLIKKGEEIISPPF
jgi:hypothetical protein